MQALLTRTRDAQAREANEGEDLWWEGIAACYLCSSSFCDRFVLLVPFLELILAHRHPSGELEYSRVAGPLSTLPGSRALKDDDVFWIASCTKLLTTICMLQCIENGLFTLDQDITTVLPEWKDPDILTGFDEETGEPILLKAKNKITIR